MIIAVVDTKFIFSRTKIAVSVWSNTLTNCES